MVKAGLVGVGYEWDRVLYDSWCKRYSDGAVYGRCGGDKDLRDFVMGGWSFPVGGGSRGGDSTIGEVGRRR